MSDITELLNKANYNFSDLTRIMEILRSENGCPWDMEQDSKSIRNNFLEETYEVVEAIDTDDEDLLREELGDVLLQVVFHSQIHGEKGIFTIEDVCDGICRKLIRRHPHIFGDVKVADSDEVLANWDNIKKDEKQHKNISEELGAIAKTLPALLYSEKIIRKAEKRKKIITGLSFYTEQLIRYLGTGEKDITEEYIGNLLFTIVNLSLSKDISPEEALQKYNRRRIEEI